MQTKRFLNIVTSTVVSALLVAASVFAVTTIGLNIDTGGNLTVSGTAAITGATTLSSTLTVAGTATSTFAGPIAQSSGNLTIGSATGNLLLNPYGGNVGIASTTPSTLFSVAGNIYGTGGLGIGVLNSTAGTIQTSGVVTIGSTLTVSGTATSTFGGPIAQSSGNLTIGSATGNLLLNPYGGNVGIASTTPSTLFSVAGNIYGTGGLGIGVLNSTAGTIQTSGVVTIGSTLTVSGTATSTFGGPIAQSSGNLIIGSATGNLLLNPYGGNIGIATTTPSTRLTLGGTGSTEGIQFGNDVNLYRSAADVLKTDDSLLITGNATTSGNFDVSGITRFGGGSQISKILFGTCSVDPPSISADFGKGYGNCSAPGVLTTDTKVFVTPPYNFASDSTVKWLIFNGANASSTADGYIDIGILNASTTAAIDAGAETWAWMVIR